MSCIVARRVPSCGMGLRAGDSSGPVRDARASFFFFLSGVFGFYPVWMAPVAIPMASPPKGTTKTARPSTNQRSTPPKGDFSYFFAWASLYFLASSTQHSRPFFFVAPGVVSTATPRFDGSATGRARTGTGTRALARVACDARPWMHPRGGAAARTDTVMATIARVRCVDEDTRRAELAKDEKRVFVEKGAACNLQSTDFLERG